jgi:hypothetical protein
VLFSLVYCRPINHLPLPQCSAFSFTIVHDRPDSNDNSTISTCIPCARRNCSLRHCGMMMTQSYFAGDLSTYGRSSHRAPSTAAYYNRSVPYSHNYCNSHQDLRSEYMGRSGNTTLITDQHIHDQHTHGQQRRRIQVAVGRINVKSQ